MASAMLCMCIMCTIGVRVLCVGCGLSVVRDVWNVVRQRERESRETATERDRAEWAGEVNGARITISITAGEAID